MRDLPHRHLPTIAGPIRRPALAHGVPAGLVAPVVMSTRDDQATLVPDDLRAHEEATGFEAGAHDMVVHGASCARRRRYRRKTTTRRDRQSALSSFVTLPIAPTILPPPMYLLAPGRIVVHAVGRVRHHQPRLGAVEHEGDDGRVRRVAADEPMASEQPQVAGLRHRYRRRALDLLHDLGLHGPAASGAEG